VTQQVSTAKTQGIPGPFCCPGCEARGEKLDGFPQHTYQCPRCNRIWHIANEEKAAGFPEIGDPEAASGDLSYSPETLDFVYPPLRVDDLEFGLSIADELITADDVDGDQVDGVGWTAAPSLAGAEHRLPLVEVTSYRTFTNAIRRRHRSARKRFSVAERTLLLIATARRGALGDWVQFDGPGNLHSVHPALLRVMATTPYSELISLSQDGLERAIRLAAEQQSTYGGEPR
jgi:hypothetical protein